VYWAIADRRRVASWPAQLAHAVRTRPEPRRVVVVAASAAALIAVPVALLRWYQADRVEALLSRYAAAESDIVETTRAPMGNGAVLVQGVAGAGIDRLPNAPGTPYFDYEVLAATFDTREGTVRVVAEYTGSNPDAALTWGITAPQSASGMTRIYFPVYYGDWIGDDMGWSCYRGLVVAPQDEAALLELRRVTEPAELPLLLPVVLTETWREQTLWQRFTR